MWKFIKNKLNKIFNKIYNKYSYKTLSVEDSYEFIWGVAVDAQNKATLYSLNDIDIVKNKKTGKYIYNIETIYIMSNTEQIKYLIKLFKELEFWMQENNYNISPEIDFFNYFPHSNEFDTIEDIYIDFKIKLFGMEKIQRMDELS